MSLAQLGCSHTLSWDDLFYYACFTVCSRSDDDLSLSLSLSLPFFTLSSLPFLCVCLSPSILSLCSPFILCLTLFPHILPFSLFLSPPPFHVTVLYPGLLLCFPPYHTWSQYSISRDHMFSHYSFSAITIICSSLSFSVGGAFVLGTYTILSLKLYSYKDVNMWCRELSTVKAKKLSRSLSCKSENRHAHADIFWQIRVFYTNFKTFVNFKVSFWML